MTTNAHLRTFDYKTMISSQSEECDGSVNIKVWFSPIPLLLGTGLFAACTAWLAFGTDTSGPIGRALSSNGDALTIITVAIGLTITLLFGFPAIRMALGMPALVASDHALKVYVLPIEQFSWSEINDVRIESGRLRIVTRAGRARSINLALLGDCEGAVAEMREVLAKQQG